MASHSDFPDRHSGRKAQGGGIRFSSIAVALIDLIGASILTWRAVAWPASQGLSTALYASRIAISSLLGGWALVYLAWALRPALPFLSDIVLVANKEACPLIVSWSALAGVSDILAGSSPFALVAGLAVASLYGWDRPLRTTLMSAGAAILGAGAGIAAAVLGAAPLDLERMVVPLVAVACSASIAYTIRSYVAPGRELLRSLEMENRQLWELSFKDPLTGLYNRRFAQETGRALIQRARRYREQFYVLMMDIDRFKRVNDQLSHARGDEVLKAVAAIIQSCLRASDSVSRYGGEEFLIYLVQADSQVAQFVANRIRDTIESTSFEGVPWQVTISVGVAGIQDEDTLDSLVGRADRYLYASKRGGRNRVSGF